MSRKWNYSGTGKYVKQVLLNDPCVYCGGPSSTVEHIEPMNGGKGRILPSTGFSVNHWTNLAGCCAKCNHERGKISLLSFLISKAEKVN